MSYHICKICLVGKSFWFRLWMKYFFLLDFNFFFGVSCICLISCLTAEYWVPFVSLCGWVTCSTRPKIWFLVSVSTLHVLRFPLLITLIFTCTKKMFHLCLLIPLPTLLYDYISTGIAVNLLCNEFTHSYFYFYFFNCAGISSDFCWYSTCMESSRMDSSIWKILGCYRCSSCKHSVLRSAHLNL